MRYRCCSIVSLVRSSVVWYSNDPNEQKKQTCYDVDVDLVSRSLQT